MATPALSVVIPARNAAATIGEQLEALLAQEWSRTWEVTVVDNGSTDATPEIVAALGDRDPRVRLERAVERTGIGYSRNVGIRASRADAIAMCDADDVVHPGWVAAIGEALQDVEFVTGPLDVHTLNADWLVRTRGLAIESGAGSFMGVFPFAHSCNVGFRRSLVDRIGYFDETLRNGSDVELSYRAWRDGVPLHYLDAAVVSYRYRTTLRDLWLQARAYGRAKPELVRRFRADGTQIETTRNWRGWLWLVRHAGLLVHREGRAAVGLGCGESVRTARTRAHRPLPRRAASEARVTGSPDPIRVRWLVKGLGPGGAERLLVAAAGAHDRDAFTFDVDYLLPWKDALVPEIQALGVAARCLEVRDERDVRWANRLRTHLHDDPVDILHAHSPYPAGIARLVVRTLPRAVRPRVVYTLHNTFGSFSPPTRVLNGLTLPMDAADIAVSREVHATMWPRLQRRTEVVVHGVQLEQVRAQGGEREQVRAELGIESDELVIATIANFRAQKDYPNLLAAARDLIDRGVAARIVAIGQGPLEAEMRARHDQLDLGDRVLLLGQRDDAMRVLAACDVFTMASDNEGLPVAIMEALALGLPVVATAVGGIPEAITDGVEGLLVPPSRPDALADAWARLAADPALRTRMAEAARGSADRFDIANAVRRIEAIYRTVLHR